jgi:hypothetical protein
MRCDPHHHPQYCGSALPAKALSVGLLAQPGPIVGHKNLPPTPAAFLRVLAPSREAVGGGEGMVTWEWLVALCPQAGSAFVLGPALAMTASHGGNAQTDKIAAPQRAVLLRGGRLPPAEVSPAALRAPRELLRRRGPLGRKSAELWAPLQPTPSQDQRPELGQQLADTATREGGDAHCPAPRVRQPLEVEIALLAHDEKVRGEGARAMPPTATAPEGPPFSR